MPTLTDLRPSPIAGSWYTSDPRRLAQQMDAYLAEARLPALDGQVVGLIAPHAGYIYSGTTAGHAFRTVQGQSFDLVAVLSPLHPYHPAALLTSAHAAYQTPLGAVQIDKPAVEELSRALTELGAPPLTAIPRDPEHSLEIELPFLQRALAGPFTLLPLMVRTHDPAAVEKTGLALAKVCQSRRVLLVGSTDLSHFKSQAAAKELDSRMLAHIEGLSPDGVLQADASGSGSACGAGAVAAVLWAARALGANAARVVHYSTSADETGDTTQVVGYGAVVVLKTP
jgi:AmmeMemoRadiSam system protein B